MNKSDQLYLIKLGEIVLKGENRNFFERKLRQNIKKKLSAFSPKFVTQKGRLFLRVSDCQEKVVSTALSTTFGIQGFSPALSVNKSIDEILQAVLKLMSSTPKEKWNTTFKINSRRADKSFPLSSYEICCQAGDAILSAYPGIKVNVHNPDTTISIELRDRAYVYITSEKGPGGLPVGCAGKGLLLLSGGIDSPVAGYRMARRGLRQDAVYFHTYPYTSDEALDKVKELAAAISEYIPEMSLYVVPFTDVQLEINRNSRDEERTLLMRYAMVKIANIIASKTYAKSLITGESLSQVASQTLESLILTDSASDIIIFRPLIGLDKEEIISTAKKIGTYEISILPYEDCCTIFSPEHPMVKPEKEKLTEVYQKIELDALIQEAVEITIRTGIKMDLYKKGVQN
ncbi:MAG: tRNA 4-thiouridine(8) synthase ThiI [Candidatus Brocadiales bacterium]|nr:tRNA 4-thiouridine(8) synthase ThiI [Candidatus Brocadiales bacterium]MBL7005942.1 tRNA 4-thiouridine(8) synthase ThiI [Spirochaetia bacterium]